MRRGLGSECEKPTTSPTTKLLISPEKLLFKKTGIEAQIVPRCSLDKRIINHKAVCTRLVRVMVMEKFGLPATREGSLTRLRSPSLLSLPPPKDKAKSASDFVNPNLSSPIILLADFRLKGKARARFKDKEGRAENLKTKEIKTDVLKGGDTYGFKRRVT